MAKSPWRKMSTAPKDGTVIIGYFQYGGKFHIESIFFERTGRSGDWYFFIDASWVEEGRESLPPIYWMPVPELPVVKTPTQQETVSA